MNLSSLPPLHGQLSLARSSVEFKDGFDIGEYISGGAAEEEHGGLRAFGAADGEEAVRCLRKAFQVRFYN